jgi:hypothetical protein
MWAAGSGGGGSIQDGDTEGQITTWDGDEWTPEGAVVVNDGNVGIGVDSPTRVLQTDGSQVDFSRGGKKLEINPNAGNANTHSTIQTDAGMGLEFSIAGLGEAMTIGADGNVNITGKLFINGEEVTAGGGDSFWVEESPGVIKYSGTAKATTLIGTG